MEKKIGAVINRSLQIAVAGVTLLMSALFFPQAVQAQVTVSISGTVSLPSGFVAPAGGTDVDITAFDRVGFSSEFSFVTIPAAANSVGYTIDVPSDASAMWEISFSCFIGCDGVLDRIFYNDVETAIDFNNATLLPGGANATGIDAIFPEASTITGTVSLPVGDVAPVGGLDINIEAFDSSNFTFFTSSVSIPSGTNSVGYTLKIPKDPALNVPINYSCLFTTGCDGYVDNGFYTASGTDPFDNSTLLSGGTDHAGINLTLLDANTITGQVSLPSGDLAPAGGIPISIIAFEPTFFASIFSEPFLTIPAGSNSIGYTIKVPTDGALSYSVSYFCSIFCDDYLANGFYSSTGTIPTDNGTLLPGGTDHIGIDLTLIEGGTISGQVTFPPGFPAPASLFLDINVTDKDKPSGGFFENVGSDFVFLAGGETSFNYSFEVPTSPTSRLVVEVSCQDFNNPGGRCDEYMPGSYFVGGVGATHNFDDAQEIVGGGDAANIDIDVIKADTIEGTVTFPAGFPASAGLELFLNVNDKDKPSGNFFELVSDGSSSFEFAGGETSFNYSVKVVSNPTARYVVQLGCDDFNNLPGECDPFLQSSYFNAGGTVFNSDDAGELPTGDQTGIDITILEGDIISGQISLPTGIATGDIDLGMSAFESGPPFNFGQFEDVSILDGTSSNSYSLKVPAGLPANNWIIRAECFNNCGSFESESFYNDTMGQTPIQEQATGLPNSQGYPNIDFSLIEQFSGAVPMCSTLLDDFSGQTVDLDNWNNPDSITEVTGGKLLLTQKAISGSDKSVFEDDQRFGATMTTLPDSFEAKVAVTEADLTASGTGGAFASLRGGYYYTLGVSDTPDDRLGLVYAAVHIGDRGAGLEAWWQILESTHPTFETFITHDEDTLIPPGTLSLNTEYLMKLDYNPATNEFTFTVDTTTNGGFGPAEGTNPGTVLWRRLVAGISPENNSDGDPLSARATFDDVMADGILFDDFSSPMLSEANWETAQMKREIVSGKLRSEIIADSSVQRSVRAQPSERHYVDSTCLQGTVSIASTSNIPGGTRARNRLDGYWFNALHDQSSYDGFDGVVWAQIAFEQTEGGSLRAAAYSEQAVGADYSGFTQLTFHVFETPVSLDTEYVMAIELDKENTQLLFRFENEVWALPILTDINPVEESFADKGFTVRTQSGPGELHAQIDDVYVTPSTPQLSVVWVDNTPGNNEVYVKISDDLTATWTQRRLSNGPSDTISPTISAGGTNLFVVYADDDAGHYDLFLKRSLDNGDVFETKKKIVGLPTNSFDPTLSTTPSGMNVYLAWQEITNADPGNIYFRRSIDEAGTFQPFLILSSTPDEAVEPDVASQDEDKVYLAWSGITGGNGDIFFRRSITSGATFRPRRTVSSTTGDSREPALAVDGPVVHMVWKDSTNDLGDIYYKRSTDNGETWPPFIQLVKTAGESGSPDIAVAGNNVYAVWWDDLGGDKDIYYKVSTDGGLSFGPRKFIANTGANSDHPSLSVKGDIVFVTFSDSSLGNAEINYKLSTDGATSFSPRRRLAGTVGESITPEASN